MIKDLKSRFHALLGGQEKALFQLLEKPPFQNGWVWLRALDSHRGESHVVFRVFIGNIAGNGGGVGEDSAIWEIGSYRPSDVDHTKGDAVQGPKVPSERVAALAGRRRIDISDRYLRRELIGDLNVGSGCIPVPTVHQGVADRVP